MTLTITAHDLAIAKKLADASAAGHGHTWYHPIALAIEREMHGCAVVTPSFIHYYHQITKRNCRADITGEPAIQAFLHAWRKDNAEPTSLSVIGVYP